MIQTVILLTIFGLIVGHLLTPSSESFQDFDEDCKDAEWRGSESCFSLTKKSVIGPAAGSDHDFSDLQRIDSFAPLPNGPPLSSADHPVATAYLEDDQEDDPRDLPWIASWTAADRFARQGQNCALKHITRASDGITIITTSKSCESGMPHTRAGDRVIIPDSIPEPLRAEIIAHELIHIYQRRIPEAWAKFYQRNWAFVFHDKPPATMPASVSEARRSNPDTYMTGWPCWKGRFWPVPVYTNPKAPSLRDARTVWWDEWQRKLLLDPPTEWTAFFGHPSQNEHPHEIAAVKIVASDRESEAGRRLLNWWLSTGSLMVKGRSSSSSSS